MTEHYVYMDNLNDTYVSEQSNAWEQTLNEGGTSDTRAALEAAIAASGAALARLDATPDPSTMPNGTVLFVRCQYAPDGPQYDYAFLRAGNGYWYSTGENKKNITSSQLHAFLMRRSVLEISIVTEWAVLYGEAGQTEDSEE